MSSASDTPSLHGPVHMCFSDSGAVFSRMISYHILPFFYKFDFLAIPRVQNLPPRPWLDWRFAECAAAMGRQLVCLSIRYQTNTTNQGNNNHIQTASWAQSTFFHFLFPLMASTGVTNMALGQSYETWCCRKVLQRTDVTFIYSCGM